MSKRGKVIRMTLSFSRSLWPGAEMVRLWEGLTRVFPRLLADAHVMDTDDATPGPHVGSPLELRARAEERGERALILGERFGFPSHAAEPGSSITFGSLDRDVVIDLSAYSGILWRQGESTRWRNRVAIELEAGRQRPHAAVKSCFLALCESLSPVLASCGTAEETWQRFIERTDRSVRAAHATRRRALPASCP